MSMVQRMQGEGFEAMGLSAGLAQEDQARGLVGTPVRQELARPIDSTTAMAAAVAPTQR